MTRLKRVWKRWKGFVAGRRVESDLHDEIAAHIDMQTEDNLRAGMPPDEARRAAVLKFGSVESITEEYRDQRSLPVLETAVADVRYAWRGLGKSPAFSLVAVSTLALGIGAVTAAFSLVNQILLHPPGLDHPERIVVVGTEYTGLGSDFEAVSAPAVAVTEAAKEVFEFAAAAREMSYNYAGPDTPQRLSGAAVSVEWFDVFGAKPQLGRVFTEEEDRPNTNRVAVLSNAAWSRLFGADPGVIGRSIELNESRYEVIGVMAPDFRRPQDVDLWVPLGLPQQAVAPAAWFNENLSLVARLQPGVTGERVNAFYTTLTSSVIEQMPPQGRTYVTDAGWSLHTRSYLESQARVTRTPVLILFGAVGAVLLVACSNVAGLMLARASTRTRELAVRAALGASRARLSRTALSESLLLAVAGGGLGVLIAGAGTELLIVLAPEGAAVGLESHLDARVLAFAVGATLVSAVLFGLVPTWQMLRSDPGASLRQGGRALAGGVHQRLRSVLVVTEAALALVLLASAGLFLRSVERIQTIDPGFDPAGVVAASFSLPVGSAAEPERGPERWTGFVRAVLEQLQGLDSVAAATIARPVPFSGILESGAFLIDGRTLPEGEPIPVSDRRWVTPGYLDTLRIPLKRGRFFTDQDRLGSERVVVIDEKLAAQYWPNQDPIDQRIQPTSGGEPLRIVGVVGQVKQSDLVSDADSGVIYISIYQDPLPIGMILVRGTRDAGSTTAVIRDVVRRVDSGLPLFDVTPMEAMVARSLAPRRFLLRVLAFFAMTALFLAALGVYGVTSYAVSQRMREIGVRIVMGARPRAVMSLVLGQGLRLAGLGVGIGIGAIVVGARLSDRLSFAVDTGLRQAQTRLFEVSAYDPLTIGATMLVLLGAALLASYLPARRAMRVDPMITLRED